MYFLDHECPQIKVDITTSWIHRETPNVAKWSESGLASKTRLALDRVR